jgi:hypothetical protein
MLKLILQKYRRNGRTLSDYIFYFKTRIYLGFTPLAQFSKWMCLNVVDSSSESFMHACYCYPARVLLI